jgi:hypothetical protein
VREAGAFTVRTGDVGKPYGVHRDLTRQMSRASWRHNDTGRCRVGSIRMLGGLNSIGPSNDTAQQRRGLLSLHSWESRHAPAVCCSGVLSGAFASSPFVTFNREEPRNADSERGAFLRRRGDLHRAPFSDNNLAHDVQTQPDAARTPLRC